MQTILEIKHFLGRNSSEGMRPENHGRVPTAPRISATGRHGREVDALMAHLPQYLGHNSATMSTCSDIDLSAAAEIGDGSPSCSSLASSQDSLPSLNACALTSQAASPYRQSKYRSITSSSLESIPETTKFAVPVVSSQDKVPQPQRPGLAFFESTCSKDSEDVESMNFRKAPSIHQPSNAQCSGLSMSRCVSSEPSQKMPDPQGGWAFQMGNTQNHSDESKSALQESLQDGRLCRTSPPSTADK